MCKQFTILQIDILVNFVTFDIALYKRHGDEFINKHIKLLTRYYFYWFGGVNEYRMQKIKKHKWKKCKKEKPWLLNHYHRHLIILIISELENCKGRTIKVEFHANTKEESKLTCYK